MQNKKLPKMSFLLESLGLFILVLEICLADVNIINIITKTEWNGREPKVEPSKLNTPVSRVIIAHTASSSCENLNTCSQQVLRIQNYHLDMNGFEDIAYNFLIGNDGNIYEGRGWDAVGALVRNYNVGSLSIAFIGSFDSALPPQAALDAANTLIEMGKNLGKLTDNFRLYGHSQLSPTISPGRAFFEIIKQWPNWSSEIS